MRDKRAEILGFNIKIERQRKKLTQANLAELTNISIESIQKIENGKQTPSSLILFDISKALNLGVQEFFKDL